MSLEDLEKELYGQRTAKSRQRQTEASPQTSSAPRPALDPWGTEQNKKPTHQSFEEVSQVAATGGKVGKVLIWLGAVLLVVLAAIATYYLYQYFTTKDVSITLTVPDHVLVGEVFTARVSFENISNKKLVAPVVSLALPDGVAFSDDTAKRTAQSTIHDLSPQETVQLEYQLLVTGKAQQSYALQAGVSYGYESSSFSNRFEKDTTVTVVAQDSVLGLDVSAPEKTLNGEEFNVDVRYQNNSDHALASTTLAFSFPQGFQVTGSDTPLNSNIEMAIPTIPAHGTGEAIVSGYMVGKEYSYFTTGVEARTLVGQTPITLAQKTVSISILPSPLAVSITRNNAQGNPDVVYAGSKLTYTVHVQNTGDTPLQGVIAKVIFDGDLFDTTSIQGAGFLNDATHSYTWTAAQIKDLQELAPHAATDISFTIMLKTNPTTAMIQNGSVKIRAQATSPTVAPNVTAKETIGIGQVESRIGGVLGFAQSVYYNEPSTDIKNNGPFPAQVGKETQFTVHWNLSGLGDFSNTVVTATLAPGVSWTGKIKVLGTDATPSYNDRTQQITWKIPALSTAAMAQQPPQLVFQIAFTPSAQYAQNTFDLISQAQLNTTETLSQKQTSVTAPAIISRQITGTGLPEGYYRVLPTQ